MAEISVRRDHYSIQITSPASRRFYIRIADPDLIGGKVKFSDFRIDAGDTELPVEALKYLQENVPMMFEASKWIFSDLLPSGRGEAAIDDGELVRRFDEIKSILSNFLSDGGRFLDNAFIEPSRGKFDGIFVFTSNPPYLIGVS